MINNLYNKNNIPQKKAEKILIKKDNILCSLNEVEHFLNSLNFLFNNINYMNFLKKFK